MADNNRIGSKRLAVGAHYGLKDWLVQRVTAVIMVLYTAIALVKFLMAPELSFEGWSALFAQQWFKLITFVALLAVFYHAFIGVRDIWMDYVKPMAVRLVLHVITIVWLLASLAWA